MNISKQNKIAIIFTSLIYLCGFFLFLEWLYPIKQITNTSNMNVFIIYAVFCFVISYLQINWGLSFLLKGLGMAFIINGIFFKTSFFSKEWLSEIAHELSVNWYALIDQAWYDLTPIFRSILFLILIWLMSYLIHYWFVYTKRLLLFIVLTFVFLGVLDTFTVYDAKIAMIRTFVIAFMSLGVANFLKIVELETIKKVNWRKSFIWIIPLIFVVLFSTVVGYAAPKFEPQWSDPVPYISELTGIHPNGLAQKKVGYGEDDSALGGSFAQDNTRVFQAITNHEQYWRIEAKETYTGKGWEKLDDAGYTRFNENPSGINHDGNYSGGTVQEAEIAFQDKEIIPKLVYPYGMRNIVSDEAMSFMLDEHSGEIRPETVGQSKGIKNYAIQYVEPVYPKDRLREEANNHDPYEVKERYTQLPQTLPERVYTLAEDITKSYDNRFDQVSAVEKYFGRNGFQYETDGVPVPAEDQDYVDQFLFESKIGYCDNYSTAMVVMLRTLNIPARWVKGFSSGEKIGETEVNGEMESIFEITNANAHSWVEVYFPKFGWIPFEPTQGFSNPTEFVSAEEELNDTETTDDTFKAPESTEQAPLEQEEQDVEKQEKEAETETVGAMMNEDKDPPSQLVWYVSGSLVIILIILIVWLYRNRLFLQTKWIERKMNRHQDAKVFQEAYHHLLKVLNCNGMEKRPDETLREFAKQIDLRYSTDAMKQLTNMYERLLYRNENAVKAQQEVTQLWKNLIREISS
ncbi:DUF4129 domain-containing transglutaminase family protein [Paracerasibacillus soli]|uniref:Transglutaminase domain-containing protein n=1 Tax=Paracerasibacillus soli TaxID=480284 RepID=A0ABU5CXA3_9BACI|nr:transglutaminase domain-containing protein [Virgibacillus soli]MDY0410516.1 transglutaminase domain-containing protein [Virgibacillus soli]